MLIHQRSTLWTSAICMPKNKTGALSELDAMRDASDFATVSGLNSLVPLHHSEGLFAIRLIVDVG